MRGKKFLAMVMTAALTISSGAAGVYGANAYSATEKEALAEWMKDIAEKYADNLEAQETAIEGSKANIRLELDDTGRAMLGMLSPTDISWLSNAEINSRVSIADGKQGMNMDLMVNGTKICTLEYYMDMENMEIYMRIPELSDSYMKMNYMEAVDSGLEAGEDYIHASADMNKWLEMSAGMSEYLPDAAALENLVNRYAAYVLDSMSDGEEGQDTLELSGVSQECTTMEGVMTEKDAITAIEGILKEAKDDEELKELLTKWSENLSEDNSFYEEFQANIEEQLEDIQDGGEDASDSSALISKIWKDDSDNIIGRKIVLIEDEEDVVSFTWQETKNGADTGLLVSLESQGEGFTVEGSGTEENGLLNGSYKLLVNGLEYVNFDVKDYDTEQAKAGKTNGVWEMTLLPGAVDGDEDAYNMVNSFMVTASAKSDETMGEISLNLSTSGASIGSIIISGDGTGEKVEIPDLASITDVVDLNNDEEMEAFGADLNIDAIMNNLTAAGAPENFVEDIINAVNGVESSSYSDEESGDITYDESADGSEQNAAA